MNRERLWLASGALLWASGSGLAAYQAAPTLGATFGAAAGGLIGLCLGRWAGNSRVRLLWIWLGCLGLLVLARTAFGTLTFFELPSRLLGAERTYLAAVAAAWLLVPLAAATALRASSERHAVGLVAEVALGAAVVSGLFSSHREGFINRPFFLVDPAWAQGIDPLPIFLAIGGATGFLLFLLASTGPGRRRSFADMAWLGLVILAVFLWLPMAALQRFEPPGSGGGKGDQQQGEKDGDSTRFGERDEPSFSNSSASQGNPPVAVVLFRDDYTPVDGVYYFRQTAFSRYNGRKLIRAPGEDRDLAETFPTPEIELVTGRTDDSYYQDLDTRVALITSHVRPFGLLNPIRMRESPNPDPVRFQRCYSVSSRVLSLSLLDLLSLSPGNPEWSQETWEQYLEGPGDRRYWELADRITATLPEHLRDLPMARAVAVKLWLEKNGLYSLKSRHGEDDADAVGEFLFGDLTGYCVHFAHAACYLYRIQGIPARVCGGYAVQASNRGNGSSVLVRGRDSHAWPEVYLDGAGWVAMDIAVERTLEPPVDPPDQGLQQMLGDMARQKGDEKEKRPDRKPRFDLQAWLRRLLREAAAVLPWAMLATLGLLYGIKVYRRLSPRLAARERLPVVVFRAQLDRLSDLGLRRKRGQTRQEFAREQAGRVPSLEPFTGLHLAATLGKGLEAADQTRLLELSGAVSREVTAAVPLWRRILGLLDPISWWRTR